MKRAKRNVEIFNMSFLDVISCGFGAVILLLVISLAFEPTNIELISKDLRGLISEKEKSRQEIVQESQNINRDLAAKKKTITGLAADIASLQKNWETLQKKYGSTQSNAREKSRIQAELRTAQQRLTDEMQRLLGQPDYTPPTENATIGGIPVDSEYIIFIIDTSGSMKHGAWPLVVKKVEEILKVYPKVKGIQVMNDMGDYMFRTYKNQWISDTPGRRALVVQRLASWNSFSNSSPVEGVVKAIRTFYRPDRPTSIYVFGDDFNGTSIDAVIKTISRINKETPSGRRHVRIHTFGFPVYGLLSTERERLYRFAHLMRLLAQQNSGSFVGLNSVR